MKKIYSFILTVFLFMSGCSDSRTVTKAENDNSVAVLPASGSINAAFTENKVLPGSFDQDFICFDSAGVTYFNLTFASDNTIYENGNYAGSYAIDGTYLDLYFTSGSSYYNTYDIVVNDALDFFQAVDSNNYLISCITTRQGETDKVVSAVTITCQAGIFRMDQYGYSDLTDNYGNTGYGTYYANMATGEFLLHYMSVDNSGNINLLNFPAQVRSMNVIDVVFPDGTEQCIYQ